jgi:hypothetical protein
VIAVGMGELAPYENVVVFPNGSIEEERKTPFEVT